jgi:NAD(P)-dependent dehydrogenase (short-subunit alcohol dehydrogenase family)
MPTVMITGAGRGLGLELVRQYAADGWDVIACARNPAVPALLELQATEPSGRVDVRALDVTDHSAVDALARALQGRALDVLVNSAGTMGARSFAREGLASGRFGESDFGDWEQVYRINVIAPMKMAEAFVEHVAASAQRRIVSLTSILGSIGGNTLGGLYGYRASKAALNAVMRTMAIDLLRSHGIIAIPLHPGWVRTDMGGPKADIEAPESARGIRAVIAGLTPEKAGRFWMYDGRELPW